MLTRQYLAGFARLTCLVLIRKVLGVGELTPQTLQSGAIKATPILIKVAFICYLLPIFLTLPGNLAISHATTRSLNYKNSFGSSGWVKLLKILENVNVRLGGSIRVITVDNSKRRVISRSV